MEEKKSHGLLIWSILLVVAVALTVVGFVFGLTKEGIGVYSSVTANAPGTSILAIKDIALPLTVGFEGIRFTAKTLPDSSYLIFAVLGIALIGWIIITVLSLVKKKAVYILHALPLSVCTFLVLYFGLALSIGFNGTTPALKLLFTEHDGLIYQSLLGKINVIQTIFVWMFFVGALILCISLFGYLITVIIRLAAIKVEKVEKEPKAAEEVAPVAVAEQVAEAPVALPEPEAVAEEVEKPKKRVFLVCKTYHATEEKVEEVVEEEPAKPVTIDLVREAIKAELDARDAKATKELNNGSVVCTPTQAPVTETRCVPTNASTKEAEKPVTPVIICIPQPVTEEQEKPVAKKEPKPRLDREELRSLVRDEIRKALSDIITVPAVEEPVETVEEIAEEPVVEEKPVENETVAVLNENNVPVEVEKEEPKKATKKEAKKEAKAAKKEAKKAEPVAEKEPEPVAPVAEPVVEPAPTTEAAPAERISFSDRLRAADDEMKENYNHIKSLLLSYGLKSRVSNGGDAFRLHKVTYAKVAVAGKSLKIYLALDPNDYKNSTLPIKDASSKAVYKDIPLVFKVKSGLSMRRCEQLIGEMMDKHGVEQVERLEIKDYVATLDEVSTDDEE